jgi:flagellar biosynthesis protein FliR
MGLAMAASDWAWLVSHAGVWALVLARVLGLCLTAPALAVPELDWRFRLGLAVLLSAVLIPVAEAQATRLTGWSIVSTAWGGLGEVLTGGVLGLSAALVVAAARLAGELIGAQAGLSAAMLLDPETGAELAPMGRLYGLIALATFLALDGPVVLVRALAESYHAVPIGGLSISRETAEVAFAHVGRALELALRAAAPAALALALAGIVLAWLGRAAASLPLITLAMPVRTLLGIAFVLLSLATLAVTLSGAWDALPWSP